MNYYFSSMKFAQNQLFVAITENLNLRNEIMKLNSMGMKE